MSIQLKIKAKHLALEIKVIRFEELKLRKQLSKLDKQINASPDNKELRFYKRTAEYNLWSIKKHRLMVVKPEIRATQLARAYLANKLYNTIEQKVIDKAALELLIPKIVYMVVKYSLNPFTNKDMHYQNGRLEVTEQAKALVKTRITAWMQA